MKKSRAELKLMAKQVLTGHYGTAVGAILILGSAMMGLLLILYFVLLAAVVGAAMGASEFSTGMGVGMIVAMFLFLILLYLVEYMVLPGMVKIYHNLCSGKQAKIGDLLFAFRNSFGKFFGVAVIFVVCIMALAAIQLVINFFGSGIMSFCYLALLMAFSIFISLNFCLFYYILVENPSVGVIDALKMSRMYMKGNRWRLLVLYLSFLGWLAISYMTCYIALLWLAPYMGCTLMMFYLDVKAEHGLAADSTGESDFQPEFYDISSTENMDA